jgi:hypothetical protein
MASQNATTSSLHDVLSAYAALAGGDPSIVVELLAADVEWWSRGVLLYCGRDRTAAALAQPRSRVEITGIRKGANVLVLEFSRPWWKRGSAIHAATASAGLRAEQTVWLRAGRIQKIETREHVPPEQTAA